MGDFALTKDHAEAFAEQLNHESRALLLKFLMSKPIDETMLEEANVEVLNIGQIESGETPRLICPHVGCEEMFRYDAAHRLAYHVRRENANGVSWGDPAREYKGTVIGFPNYGNDDGDDWYNRTLYCPACSTPIAVPAGFRISE